jgi:16S rRNA (adenine1518-N6/adenine1519-N6)-dimethyltransferase
MRSPRRSTRTRPRRSDCFEATKSPVREADQGRGFRWNREVPPGATMSINPKKRLGQHFLVDENILGVIGRLADLADDDVVLEIGPGLGILTVYLADRVSRVYAVELDESLEPELRGRLAGRPNVELRFGDAVQLDLAEAAPGATKLVANLPYNVATPLIAESLDRLPGIELWTVMVQREVADRFFAKPSTKAYGAVSVLVQLVAERTGFHPVSPAVFRPRPNVDSALVAFRRTGLPHDFRRVKRVVEGSFAHRRKRLANSLELAGVAARGPAEEAIALIGRPPNVRAEELAPHEFLALAEALK